MALQCIKDRRLREKICYDTFLWPVHMFDEQIE